MTVETELYGSIVTLSAFVTNVLPDTLWLALRTPDERLRTIEPGQPLHLTFEADGAPVVAESTFLRRLGAERGAWDKSRVFSVIRPVGIESMQRRAHVRVEIERLVYIRSLALAVGPPQIGIGRTTNVSAGGLLLTTRMPLAFGDQLRIALVLAKDDLVVSYAQVVRIEEAGTGKPGESRVALRFDRIAEADQERITCHILSAHRRRRPSSGGPSVAIEVVSDGAAADGDSADHDADAAPDVAPAG